MTGANYYSDPRVDSWGGLGLVLCGKCAATREEVAHERASEREADRDALRAEINAKTQ